MGERVVPSVEKMRELILTENANGEESGLGRPNHLTLVCYQIFEQSSARIR